MTDKTAKTGETIPRPEDVASPDAIIKAMYESISGPAGPRNWYRDRSLYMEGAQLIPIGKRVHKEADFKVMNVEEWIEDAEEYLNENDFYESEIMRKSMRFGDIMQVFSTYEARNDPDGPPFARGVNAILLLHREDRWWIVNMMWDNESKENPIPEEFLPYLW